MLSRPVGALERVMSLAESDTDLGSPKTVLVVEDEALIRMNVADYLADRGFHILEAANADEAIAVASDGRHAIHAVFTDVRMPGSMDGFSLAAWFRENRRSLPIIIASGDIGMANISRKSLGEIFVSKPYQLHAVADAIQRAIDAVD